jgi:hypothetical protein
MSNPTNNPDKAHGNHQEDNITNKTEAKKDIYERLRAFSILDDRTILQVDATVIVGVLFFLTLTSLLGSEEETAKMLAVITTLITILPFSLSAMFSLWTYCHLHLRIRLRAFVLMRPIRLEKLDYRKLERGSQYAVFLLFLGLHISLPF